MSLLEVGDHMKDIRRFLLLIALAIIPTYAFGASSPAAIDIGVLLCLSGNCSDWGSAASKGIQLAASELNEGGGVLGRPITLHIEDTRESISGAQAVTAFSKLTAVDGMKLIIGPSWSPGALAIAPLARELKDVLVITPSASAEEFSRAGANLFNMRPAERYMTEDLARCLYRKGMRRAAVLTSTQAAESTQGRFFRDAFQAAGGTIVRYVETNPAQPDVRTEVTQVVSSRPDAVFLMAYNQMIEVANILHSLGYSGQIAAISIDDARVLAAGGALEGFVVARALPPSRDFTERFSREFDEPPGLSADNGYDSMLALAKAITAAGSTDASFVARKLKEVRFKGAGGEISFDENRGVQQKSGLYRVVDGELRELNREQ